MVQAIFVGIYSWEWMGRNLEKKIHSNSFLNINIYAMHYRMEMIGTKTK